MTMPTASTRSSVSSRSMFRAKILGDKRDADLLGLKPLIYSAPMGGGHIRELRETLDGLSTNREQSLDHYKRRVPHFIRAFTAEELEEIQPGNELERMALVPIRLGMLFLKNRNKEIDEYVSENMMEYLVGSTRAYDYFVSMVLRFYYLARKCENRDSSVLFSLLVCNKELGNEESVSVLTNCILDMLVSNKIFQRIENPISSSAEQARYSYYNGVISMVEGEYEEALRCFHTGAVLSSGRLFNLMLEKCIIVCMLLVSDYNIPYAYGSRLRPYFELISAVKQADLDRFESVLLRHKDEFMEEGLYFVIRRLLRNVVQEGIRKISLVYSRISFKDIAHLLRMSEEDVGLLVQKTVRQGFVRGRTADGVFHSAAEDALDGNIRLNVRECIDLTRVIQEHMKYPSITPMCYEKVVEANGE
jgi:26S proteasome regulatory subunit N3